jgi:threonine dehydratase
MITPQKSYPDLARAVGVSFLYLKREDLHPYGSHKGRSIPVMIDHYLKEGKRHFAISSSGNAALAAALYVKELNKVESKDNALARNSSTAATQDERKLLRHERSDMSKSYSVVVGGVDQVLEKIKLEILVGNHILDKKLKKLTDLADDNVSVMRFERPLQSLTQKTADGSIQSLRQSIDDTALLGYESLAKELEEIKDLQAIFVATSSGTTARALAEYFEKGKKEKNKEGKIIEIHIVQTTSCHPIALEFVNSVGSEEQSSADAIVDITAHRKDALIPLIQKTNGSGWIASNEEIRTAQELIEKHAKIKVSPNGALALAGLMQAVFTGREWEGAVVCVVGGE